MKINSTEFAAASIGGAALVMLTSCEPAINSQTIVVLDKGSAGLTATEGEVLDKLDGVCEKKVEKYLPGTAHIIRIDENNRYNVCAYDSGKPEAGGKKTADLMLVSVVDNGEEREVMEPLVQDLNNPESGFGYGAGTESHPIVYKGVLYSPGGNPVSTNDGGKSVIDKLIEISTGAYDVSAAGLPTERPAVTKTPFVLLPATKPVDLTEEFMTPVPTDIVVVEQAATPVPAETERFSVDNITNIPKSAAEIPNRCVEVVNPIDDPSQFELDMKGYVASLEKDIFPGYDGPVLRMHTDQLGMGPDNLSVLPGQKLNPVACLRTVDKGRDVVMLTFVGADSTGLIPLNIFLDPDQVSNAPTVKRDVDSLLKAFPITTGGNLASFDFAYLPYHKSPSIFRTDFQERYFKAYPGLSADVFAWAKNGIYTGKYKALLSLDYQVAQ